MQPRTMRWGLGVVLSLSLAVLGVAVGAIVARQVSQGGMGWDQIADVLGGMMLGAAAGLVLAVLLSRRLGLPALRGVTLASGLLAGGLLLAGIYRVRQESQRAAAEAAMTRPVAPTQVAPPP